MELVSKHIGGEEGRTVLAHFGQMARFGRVQASGGAKPRKVLWSLWSPSCLVIKALWSGLWSGYGRYGQWSLLFNFGPLWRPRRAQILSKRALPTVSQNGQFVRVHGLRGGQNPENCYGHYGHLVFFTKVLWSRLWSRLYLWSLRFPKSPRPDHSDHSLTIGLTIALYYQTRGRP